MFDAFVSEVARFPLTASQLVIVGKVGDNLPVHPPRHTGKANC
jgi:hypothetical protein